MALSMGSATFESAADISALARSFGVEEAVAHVKATVIRNFFRQWKTRKFFSLLCQASAAAIPSNEGDTSLRSRTSRQIASVQWTKLRMRQALTSLAADRKDFYAKAMEKELDKLKSASAAAPPTSQGGSAAAATEGANSTVNMEFYSRDAIIRRNLLRTDPRMLRCLQQFWNVGAVSGERSQTSMWKKKQYVGLLVAFSKALLPKFNKKTARKVALADFKTDSHGEGGVSYQHFQDGLFELVDSWVDSIDVHRYCDFLEKLFDLVVEAVEVPSEVDHTEVQPKPLAVGNSREAGCEPIVDSDGDSDEDPHGALMDRRNAAGTFGDLDKNTVQPHWTPVIVQLASVPARRKLRPLRGIAFARCMELLEQPPRPNVTPMSRLSAFFIDDAGGLCQDAHHPRCLLPPPLPLAFLDDGGAGHTVAAGSDRHNASGAHGQRDLWQTGTAGMTRMQQEQLASGKRSISGGFVSDDDSDNSDGDDDGDITEPNFYGADGLLKLGIDVAAIRTAEGFSLHVSADADDESHEEEASADEAPASEHQELSPPMSSLVVHSSNRPNRTEPVVGNTAMSATPSSGAKRRGTIVRADADTTDSELSLSDGEFSRVYDSDGFTSSSCQSSSASEAEAHLDDAAPKARRKKLYRKRRISRRRQRFYAAQRIQKMWRGFSTVRRFRRSTRFSIQEFCMHADKAQIEAWLFTPQGRKLVPLYFHPCHRLRRDIELSQGSPQWLFESVDLVLDKVGVNRVLDFAQSAQFALDVLDPVVFCRVVPRAPFDALHSQRLEWKDEQRISFTPSGAIAYGQDSKQERSVTMRADRRLRMRFKQGQLFQHKMLLVSDKTRGRCLFTITKRLHPTKKSLPADNVSSSVDTNTKVSSASPTASHLETDGSGNPSWWADDNHTFVAVGDMLDELGVDLNLNSSVSSFLVQEMTFGAAARLLVSTSRAVQYAKALARVRAHLQAAASATAAGDTQASAALRALERDARVTPELVLNCLKSNHNDVFVVEQALHVLGLLVDSRSESQDLQTTEAIINAARQAICDHADNVSVHCAAVGLLLRLGSASRSQAVRDMAVQGDVIPLMVESIRKHPHNSDAVSLACHFLEQASQNSKAVAAEIVAAGAADAVAQAVRQSPASNAIIISGCRLLHQLARSGSVAEFCNDECLSAIVGSLDGFPNSGASPLLQLTVFQALEVLVDHSPGIADKLAGLGVLRHVLEGLRKCQLPVKGEHCTDHSFAVGSNNDRQRHAMLGALANGLRLLAQLARRSTASALKIVQTDIVPLLVGVLADASIEIREVHVEAVRLLNQLRMLGAPARACDTVDRHHTAISNAIVGAFNSTSSTAPSETISKFQRECQELLNYFRHQSSPNSQRQPQPSDKHASIQPVNMLFSEHSEKTRQATCYAQRSPNNEQHVDAWKTTKRDDTLKPWAQQPRLLQPGFVANSQLDRLQSDTIPVAAPVLQGAPWSYEGKTRSRMRASSLRRRARGKLGTSMFAAAGHPRDTSSSGRQKSKKHTTLLAKPRAVAKVRANTGHEIDASKRAVVSAQHRRDSRGTHNKKRGHGKKKKEHKSASRDRITSNDVKIYFPPVAQSSGRFYPVSKPNLAVFDRHSFLQADGESDESVELSPRGGRTLRRSDDTDQPERLNAEQDVRLADAETRGGGDVSANWGENSNSLDASFEGGAELISDREVSNDSSDDDETATASFDGEDDTASLMKVDISSPSPGLRPKSTMIAPPPDLNEALHRSTSVQRQRRLSSTANLQRNASFINADFQKRFLGLGASTRSAPGFNDSRAAPTNSFSAGGASGLNLGIPRTRRSSFSSVSDDNDSVGDVSFSSEQHDSIRFGPGHRNFPGSGLENGMRIPIQAPSPPGSPASRRAHGSSDFGTHTDAGKSLAQLQQEYDSVMFLGLWAQKGLGVLKVFPFESGGLHGADDITPVKADYAVHGPDATWFPAHITILPDEPRDGNRLLLRFRNGRVVLGNIVPAVGAPGARSPASKKSMVKSIEWSNGISWQLMPLEGTYLVNKHQVAVLEFDGAEQEVIVTGVQPQDRLLPDMRGALVLDDDGEVRVHLRVVDGDHWKLGVWYRNDKFRRPANVFSGKIVFDRNDEWVRVVGDRAEALRTGTIKGSYANFSPQPQITRRQTGLAVALQRHHSGRGNAAVLPALQATASVASELQPLHLAPDSSTTAKYKLDTSSRNSSGGGARPSSVPFGRNMGSTSPLRPNTMATRSRRIGPRKPNSVSSRRHRKQVTEPFAERLTRKLVRLQNDHEVDALADQIFDPHVRPLQKGTRRTAKGNDRQLPSFTRQQNGSRNRSLIAPASSGVSTRSWT